MRTSVNLALILFIAALLPLSAVLAGTSTPTAGETSLSPQLAAYNMLTVTSGVANYTASLVSAANGSGVSIPLDEYLQAEALFKRASDLYSQSQYNESISASKAALGLYDAVIQTLSDEMNALASSPGVMTEAMAFSNRTAAYLSYAKELLTQAKRMGVNATEMERDYETLHELYMKMQRDLASGNSTAVQLDMYSAKKAMEKMQKDVVAVNNAMGKAQAKNLTMALMSKVRNQLLLTEHLMMTVNGSSENLSKLNKNFLALQAMYSQLEHLEKSGDYSQALDLIDHMSSRLEKVVSVNREIMKGVKKGHGSHSGNKQSPGNQTNQSSSTNSTTSSENWTSAQNESCQNGSNIMEPNGTSTNTTEPADNGSNMPGNHTGHKGGGNRG